MCNGVNKMKHKLKKNLRDIVLAAGLGLATTGAAIGWLAWDNYQINQKREQYSNLPTIETHLRKGRGVEDMTARYVDTDIYPSKTVRIPVLKKDNPQYAEDPSWEGRFKVHYDPEYCARKKQKE